MELSVQWEMATRWASKSPTNDLQEHVSSGYSGEVAVAVHDVLCLILLQLHYAKFTLARKRHDMFTFCTHLILCLSFARKTA